MEKYYQILGLVNGASKKEIQEAYEKLSKELNPDNNENLEFFQEEYDLVQEAYNKLLNKPYKKSDLKLSNKKDKSSDQNKKKKSIKGKPFMIFIGILTIIILFPLIYNMFKVEGCMDPEAINYNPEANTEYNPSNCIPKIFGCTDSNAINYNSEANVMLDRSCIKIEYVKNLKTSKIFIDQNKYRNVEYEFIYNIEDTISDKFESNSEYSFRKIIINKIDLIRYKTSRLDDNNLSSIDLPINKRILVKEDIIGYETKKYYIKIEEDSEYILNPRKYYKYRFERAVYSTQVFNFDLGGYVNRERGFIIKIEDDIDYWFEDLPSSIMIYTITANKHNVKRYR
jgi:curved DNA-binding protein CbpA